MRSHTYLQHEPAHVDVKTVQLKEFFYRVVSLNMPLTYTVYYV